MQELDDEWEDALFWAVPQINSQIIKYLSYFPIKIITRI